MFCNRWFDLRKQAEVFYGVEQVNGACHRYSNKYIPMKLDFAKMPILPNFIFDDSPDRIKPTAVSRFITEDYDLFVGGHVSHRTKA